MSLSAQTRIIVLAPRVSAPREMSDAVTLALAHARARLTLPAFSLHWVDAPSGPLGACCWFDDGGIEVLLNAGREQSARSAAWTLLHELKHAADGRRFCAQYPELAEDAANAFAFDLMERQTQDFYSLDWRRFVPACR